MPRFVGLNLLWCTIFRENRFLLIINLKFPITFTHQKIHNPNFFHLKFYFWITIWKRLFTISQGNTSNLSWDSTKDFLQKRFILFIFNFLGLGLRPWFNKVGYHIYVHDFNSLWDFILYICLMYICILYNILQGIKYMVSFHILICNLLRCNCVVLPTPNIVFILWLFYLHIENLFNVHFHH